MRPIDADTLLDGLDENCGDLDLGYNSEYAKLVHYIDSQPTLDYEPVRHGEIIESNENGKRKRVFSCCGTDFTKLTMWMIPKYCPNCGAKMGKGDA